MKKIGNRKAVFLILASAIMVRLIYILLMPVVNFAQYDIGMVYWDQDVFTGHLGYVMYLVKNHALPNFDPREVYQFNHPPVHPILGALVVSFVRIFTEDVKVWTESLQWLSFVYSAVTLFAVAGILEEMKISHKGKIVALLVWSFQPTLIMTAGSINNDGAGLMFQVLAVWFALRWHRTKKYADIFGVALTVSIGMLCKLSAGLVAVPIGFLFVYDFIKEWKTEKTFPVKRFVQFIAFGAVCFPIGLSWVIRCYVRFGMPPTYIAYLPDTSPQYVGMYSDFQRMFFPNPIELLTNLSHGSIGMGWNVWVQLLRTSALGECDLSLFPMWGKLLCLAMMALNFIVAVWAFAEMAHLYIVGLWSKKGRFASPERPVEIKLFWLIGWAVMMYSYLSFAYTYPHECSMNFRYVQFAILPPLVALAERKPAYWRFFVYLYVACALGITALWCMAA